MHIPDPGVCSPITQAHSYLSSPQEMLPAGWKQVRCFCGLLVGGFLEGKGTVFSICKHKIIFKKTRPGLERWLSGQKCLLLLGPVSMPSRKLTTICNSISHWSLWALYTYVHIHMCSQTRMPIIFFKILKCTFHAYTLFLELYISTPSAWPSLLGAFIYFKQPWYTLNTKSFFSNCVSYEQWLQIKSFQS